jgi:glycosyltransferase involved in cell wall biosynthesis
MSNGVALVGTRGLPPRYGGFEAALGKIAPALVREGLQVTVYCRDDGPREFCGARLVRLPALRLKWLETLCHTLLSLIHCSFVSRPDVVVMFNAANAPLLYLFRFRRVIIHVDGLEWKRAKWGRLGKAYYRFAERVAAARGSTIIADARGIQDYYRKQWSRESVFIPYGADRIPPRESVAVAGRDLAVGSYYLVVARFEPENHVLEIVQAYKRSGAARPLIVVGSAPYSSDYIALVKSASEEPSSGEVVFLGAVWDEDLLDSLYSCSRAYIHGHSVGGTNPSLLRACASGAPVIAWDVNFNREVLGNQGRYFDSVRALMDLVAADDHSTGVARAEMPDSFWDLYNWASVCDRYVALVKSYMP